VEVVVACWEMRRMDKRTETPAEGRVVADVIAVFFPVSHKSKVAVWSSFLLTEESSYAAA